MLKSRKRGRGEYPRDNQMNLRLSDEELEQILDAAHLAGETASMFCALAAQQRALQVIGVGKRKKKI